MLRTTLASAIALVLFLGSGVSVYAGDESAWEPLELELPPPVFTGTPADLNSPNLEPRPDEPKQPVKVPPGVENLALDKILDSDVAFPTFGSLEQITDGDKRANYRQVVQLPEGKHYVQIDLEEEYPLYAIAFWHYHEEARIYFDVVVQIGNDENFFRDVTTVFNNDHDNSLGLGVGKDKEYVDGAPGKVIPIKGAKARYVRLYSNGNTTDDRNHYVEVEVYGLPDE